MVFWFIRAVLYTIPCQFWAFYGLFRHAGCQEGVNKRLKVNMDSIIY